MMRSSCGTKLESAFRKVVLPLPVPPETTREMRPFTAARNRSAIGWRSAPISISRSIENGFFENFRIDTSGPSIAIGLIATLTRDPSGSRASTVGDNSSILRPTPATIF